MESLLQSAIPDRGAAAAAQGRKPQSVRPPEPVPIEGQLANLVINETGSEKYIGVASGLSILSPRGLAWIEKKTGSNRMRGVLLKFQRNGILWPSSRLGDQWNEVTSVKHNLPSKEAAIHLVNHYFDFFNVSFPLIDRQKFWVYFERQYNGGDGSLKKSWFALFNAVLSIGCITATDLVSTNVLICDPYNSTNMPEMATKFLQNACSVLLNVFFADPDLMAVQAMIAMVAILIFILTMLGVIVLTVGQAFVMQAIMNPEGAFTIIGTAARLATTLGLHQWLEGFGLSKADLEQRQRVFWVLYILEKDLSFRIGRPSAIDDNDIQLEAALSRVYNDLAIPVSFKTKDNRKFYAFKSMCGLAVIQSKTYRQLYRTDARGKTASERLKSIGNLDAELQEWKDQFPEEIRPEHRIQCVLETRFPIIVLHCGYYHCLAAIHRANAIQELWTAEAEMVDDDDSAESASPSDRAWANTRIQSSHALCLASARSVLYLSIEYLDSYSDPHNSLIWVAPYFPIMAFLFLFTNILQNPLDPRADDDQALMEGILNRLSRTTITDDVAVVIFISDIIGEILVIVRDHVKNARARLAAAPTEQYGKGGPQPSGVAQQPRSYMHNAPAGGSPLSTPSQTTSQHFYTNGQTDPAPVQEGLFEPPQFYGSFSTQPPFANPNVPSSIDVAANPGQPSSQPPSTDDPFYMWQYGEWGWTS
ncbi:hypothetical protein A1O3_05867 [Capronia epimyces CBS 606.96]|uniref:Xylanolytic transcriptional activator regulatory domain-containing protein n=1 Tax=Capronia epimyces CBS 606.96 TaxID=1182542 RepID=W9XX88_9EURO|nr:uncharacterized protein A1O3_05867 [Capronia epimyces CBS 606.96]EXJ85192.1 hypothetical protein A1O3_05867 [Capronia epimyces CBS 606.96]